MTVQEKIRLSPEEKKDREVRGPRSCTALLLEIPEGVERIGDGAFRDCGEVLFVVLPSSLRTIGKRAFSDCSSLAEVQGGENVERIEDEAFAGCMQLKMAFLPAKLAHLGSRAFADCRKMQVLGLPAGLMTLGEQPFYRCENLAACPVPAHLSEGLPDEARLGVADIDGCMIRAGELEVYLGRQRNIVVPADVRTIRAGAFDDLPVPPEGLEIRLPDGLRTLERSEVFSDERVSVTLPENYLRQPQLLPAAATVELLDGVWRNDVLAADVASLFLFQQGALLNKAAALLEERDPGHMAALMQRRIGSGDLTPRRQRRARARLAEFCFAHAADLPAAWQQTMFPADQPPAALVLEANSVNPESPQFARVLARGGEKKADLTNVRTALAGYLAVGQHCERLDTDPFVSGPAEEAAAKLDGASLAGVLPDLLKEDRPAHRYAFLRFCTGDQARAHLSALESALPRGGGRQRPGPPDRRAVRPLFLNAAGETLIAMVRAEAAHPEAGLLRQHLETAALLEQPPDLCFPAPLGLDAAGSKEYRDAAGVPLVRLFFEDGAFHLLNMRTKRRCKSLPIMPEAAELRMQISQDMASVRDYYADLTAWIHRQQLDGFLLGSETPFALWQQIYRNPFLATEGAGIIWVQGGRTFVWDGCHARSPRGRRLKLEESSPIQVAHPLEMTAEERDAWEAWFTRRPATDRFAQLAEPAYTVEEIRPDRYAGCVIEGWDLQKAEPQLGLEQSLREQRSAFAIGRGGTLKAAAPGVVRGSAGLALGELSLKTLDRCGNHALYLLDCWTLPQRIARDDLSTLKILERLPREALAPHLKTALSSDAPRLTAALLEHTNGLQPARDQDEFTLDL